MMTRERLAQIQRRFAETCAVMVGLLAGLVLLSWRFDFWRLAALSSDYVPMAPGTAWLLLLLAGAVFLSLRRPDAPAVRWFGRGAAAGTLLMGLLVWLRFLMGFDLPLERWLAPGSSQVGGIPVGRMSPLTATVFLSTALAFLFRPHYSPEQRRRWAALPFTLATLVISLAVLFSYGVGAPLLYGSQVIPMALPSAICFCLLGLCLLPGLGHDTWPLSLFPTGTAMLSPSSFRGIAVGPLLAAFLLLSLAIGGVGGLYLKKQIALSRQAVQKELSAISELKSGQIAEWYAARQSEARILFHNTLIQPQLRRYLAESDNAPAARDIREWLDYRQKRGFRRMILFDATGSPRLWAPSAAPPPHHDYRNELHATLKTNTILTTDLHRDPAASAGQPQEINLDIWIPIGGTPGSAGSAKGALLIQIDPYRFLYPLVQTWPTPSRSAETLLVRREGNEVVFLNDVRHRPNSALSLRRAFEPRQGLPAARAVAGYTGVVEGPDYRGVPTLAALCSVPGTPWFMVSKVDREEILAPVRQQAWKTGGIILTLILAAALGMSLLWKQRDNLLLRQRLAVELERTQAVDELRRQKGVLEAINQIFHHALTCGSEEELGQVCLDVAERLTESTFGYIGAVDAAGRLDDYAISDSGRAACRIAGPAGLRMLSKSLELRGLYGRVIRDGKGFYANDPASHPDSIGAPEGHPPLRAFLGVPLFRGTEIIGIAAVGNREGGYGDDELRTLEAIAPAMVEALMQKKAEGAVQESERRLRRAEAAAHLGHWRIDLGTGLTTWSDEMYRIFGVTPGAFQPSPESYMALIHPDDRGKTVRAEEAMRLEGSGGYEFRILLPNGALRHVTGSGEMERDGADDGIALFGTLLDVTELRQKERELQEKNTELERFTYMISHDLKSPLVTVKAFLGYLEQDLASGDAGRIEKDVFYIRTAADKMGRLLDELLEMSRIGRVVNQPVRVTFRELVDEVLNLVAGGIAERGVEVSVSDEPLVLHGDRPRLVEIWQNLVENAVKFTSSQPLPRIEIGVERHKAETVFFVRDNGMGIDPKYREKVFGLFEKLDPRSEGTGLGLALVKRIVELYGGSIRLESAGAGQGTCFRFTLPMALTTEASAKRHEEVSMQGASERGSEAYTDVR